jgi:hypothetical protein
MANTTTATCLPLFPSLEMAWRDVDSSFERFCLTAGIGAVEQMLREDAQQLTGAPHRRGGGRVGHRWGTTESKSRTRDLGKRAAGWLSTYLHLFLVCGCTGQGGRTSSRRRPIVKLPLSFA